MTATLLTDGRSAPAGRRPYPPQFRRLAVRQVLDAIEDAGGNPFGIVPSVARELGIPTATLRTWVRRADQILAEPAPRNVPPRAEVWERPRLTLVREAPARAEAPGRAEAPATGRLRALALELRWPLSVYAVSRLLVLVAMGVAVSRPGGGLTAGRVPVPWPLAGSTSRLLGSSGIWDAAWYVHIAAHGYAPPPLPGSPLGWDMAFFPLFPGLVRGLSVLTGLTPLAAGLALGLLIGALAAVAVGMLARHLAGEEVADRAVLLWSVFPGAFVLSMAYSEGLTALAAAACLLALLRRRWVVAGLSAAVATATAPSALVLVACCGWAAFRHLREAPPEASEERPWAALSAPALAPLGAVGYFAYLWVRTGDLLARYHSEKLFWDHGGVLRGLYKTTLSPIGYVVGHPLQLDNAVMLVAGWWWPPSAGRCCGGGGHPPSCPSGSSELSG